MRIHCRDSIPLDYIRETDPLNMLISIFTSPLHVKLMVKLCFYFVIKVNSQICIQIKEIQGLLSCTRNIILNKFFHSTRKHLPFLRSQMIDLHLEN